ncbi:SpoIIE family protein phosphatase [Microbispora sp. H10670]|uniref:SpoIIE family protein phosphatase n=1 Tax=Microbispora sp. H10670 TaxID=2729108 RepID=UPI002873CEC6|nr:SpoIIE family protein phosphatase [Microbispora sp. H10670]
MHVGHERETSRIPLDLFDQAPVGVLVTRGEDHRLVYTNAAVAAMFGERPDGEWSVDGWTCGDRAVGGWPAGTPVREALPGLVRRLSPGTLGHVLKTGEAACLDEVVVTVTGPGGASREGSFRLSLSRVPLTCGENGLLAVVQEITAHLAAARRVRVMEKEWRRIQRRYQSMVWADAHLVWVTGPHGEAREMSQGWQRLTGQSVEESLGDGWFRAVHPEDRAAAVESWDRATEEAVSLYEQIYRVRTPDGRYRHVRYRAVPVHEDGEVVEWVGASTDVEQEWQEARRRRLLDRAAAAASDISNLEEMCQEFANVIVPELADSCYVYLLPEAIGAPPASIVTERVASAVREGLPSLPARRKEYHPADSGFVRAVRQRRPLQATFPPGRPPFPCADNVTAWIEEAGEHSLAIMPVVVEGEVATVVVTGVCGDRPPIAPDDVRLMREMLDHTHDAVSKALRFRRSQRVALALQHSLLAEPPRVPGLEIAARYQASPTAAEIGGDWYDAFVPSGGALDLVIGDVAGHDLAAAVCMSQVRNMLRALAVDRDESPGHVLRRLNAALETLNGESTATCVLTRAEREEEGGWRLAYSVAGHPPPLLVTGDGRSRFLRDARNPLLGLDHDRPWASAVEPLPPHATLLLYTDGLVERRGEDIGDGLERLRRCAEPLARAPLGRFCDELLTGMPLTGEDDIAMIALRLPSAAALS